MSYVSYTVKLTSLKIKMHKYDKAWFDYYTSIFKKSTFYFKNIRVTWRHKLQKGGEKYGIHTLVFIFFIKIPRKNDRRLDLRVYHITASFDQHTDFWYDCGWSYWGPALWKAWNFAAYYDWSDACSIAAALHIFNVFWVIQSGTCLRHEGRSIS